MHPVRSALLTVLLASCSNRSEPPAPPPVSEARPAKDVATARAWIASGAVVIDVRTPEEFNGGHMPAATNIPVQELERRLPDVDKLVGGNKATRVVVYCAAGSRAAKAKQRLDAAGYTQVVNGGGLDDLQ